MYPNGLTLRQDANNTLAAKVKRILNIVLACCMSIVSMAQLNTDRITAIRRNALYFEDYVLSSEEATLELLERNRNWSLQEKQ